MSNLSGRFEDKKVDWGIGASLGIGFAAFILPQVLLGIGLAVYASFTDQELDEIVGDENIVMSFVLTIFITAIGIGIVTLFLKRKDIWSKLGLNKVSLEDLGLALPAYVVYFVLAIVANIALAAAFPELAEQEQDVGFMNAHGFELVLAFLTLVILAPFYEELLFRGFVFRGLAKATSFWPAAIAVSALFGLAHGQLNVAIDTFLIGMVASWLVWNTKSVWPAILLHGIKNFVAYLFIFIFEVNI